MCCCFKFGSERHKRCDNSCGPCNCLVEGPSIKDKQGNQISTIRWKRKETTIPITKYQHSHNLTSFIYLQLNIISNIIIQKIVIVHISQTWDADSREKHTSQEKKLGNVVMF